MSLKTPWNKIVSKIILLALMFYIGYNLIKVYNNSDSIPSFVIKIWDYVIIKNADFQLTIGKLFIEIGLLVGSYYLAQYLSKKFIPKILLKTNLDIGARASVLKLSNYGLFSTFIIISLSIAQIPLTAFTFIGGALAIGAGFGTQNMINNFISGIIIQIEKPIKFGDTVQVDGQIGRVDEIGARSTKVLLSNNTHLIIPNSFFLEKNISNWHFKNDLVKSKILIEISLGQNFEDFQKKIIESLKSLHISKVGFLISEIKLSGYLVEISFDLRTDESNKQEVESLVKLEVLKLHQKNEIKLAVSK